MMDKRIDLHTHSIYSDGSMTPAELVRHAKDEGLSAIALSDHDSIGGVAEALEEGKRIGIEVIPAIELSAEAETETHILGYYIDINNKALLDKLEYVRQVRREREEEICDKLRDLGFDVSMEEVEELAETDVTDYEALLAKQAEIAAMDAEIEALETEWLELGELLGQ